jgi:hypothetical protein
MSGEREDERVIDISMEMEQHDCPFVDSIPDHDVSFAASSAVSKNLRRGQLKVARGVVDALEYLDSTYHLGDDSDAGADFDPDPGEDGPR